MSQKVKILSVKHSGGSVYLGHDRSGNPMWTNNPERIMDWLCDGWRFRFNQHRSLRTKRVHDKDGLFKDVQLGGGDASRLTDKVARAQYSWLRSLPAMVIQSAQRIENQSWFAGIKRRGKSGGRVPGFRSRRRAPQSFICWYNGGANANFHRTGRRTGVVTISGQNPRDVTRPSCVSRWRIQIRVRVTEPIRPYTSVNVNWTAKALTFTNSPEPIARQPTGSIIGLDRGVNHTLATSNGEFIGIPRENVANQSKYLGLQRKLARQDRTNEARGGKKAKLGSRRRQRTLAQMQSIASREARRRKDWIHQTTTQLVRDHDLIVLEALNVKGMTKRAHGHGRAAKAGLNRSILRSNWSAFLGTLQYKAGLAGVEVRLVNPAYTSQTCHACGHIAPENRESQAVFRCKECGHEANADVNAALNILWRGMETGQDNGLGRGGKVRPRKASAKRGAPSETSTPALAGGLK